MKQGHNRISTWRVVLLVLLALPAGLVGFVVYQHYVPHLLLNETTRYLYQYRDLRERFDGPSLVPDLFESGETKDAVRHKLLSAGLDPWSTSSATMPLGAMSMEKYRLGAGALNFACGSQLFLTIGYDADDRLVSAVVEQGGACL